MEFIVSLALLATGGFAVNVTGTEHTTNSSGDATLESLQLELEQLRASLDQKFSLSDRNSNNSWILSNAFVVLTMQAGFAMLEAGMVSTKNSANILVRMKRSMIEGEQAPGAEERIYRRQTLEIPP